MKAVLWCVGSGAGFEATAVFVLGVGYTAV